MTPVVDRAPTSAAPSQVRRRRRMASSTRCMSSNGWASSGSGVGCRPGAAVVGPGVVELLHSATVAVAGQVPIDRLWHAVPCFPTISEVWLRLMEAHRDSADTPA